MNSSGIDTHDCARPLKMLDVPGFCLCEASYDAGRDIPTQPHSCAQLCLTIDGGYDVEWCRGRLHCGPAALVFHPPGDAYGVRISDAGSRCMTVSIEPGVLARAADEFPDLERLQTTRRAPPRWLAFQLRRELELRDDLSTTSVESLVLALLAELGERPGLEARQDAPPWLERVREQIDDEFRRHQTLVGLAHCAGVHHVHLAREFRQRFGCTVGHYIRQRRIEFACHRLTASQDSLSTIAFQAGFSDQSHFTNTFRKLVGTTPHTFRARFATSSQRPPTRR
ncbi:MAG: helix-turn-helix domain-containing protein [Longimicrobiales bacterium]